MRTFKEWVNHLHESEEKGFLNALQEKPDDWVTRQAYADWLAERGQDKQSELQRWFAQRQIVPNDDTIHQSLDQDLENWELRSRYADLLDSQGRTREANAQRWMIQWKQTPRASSYWWIWPLQTDVDNVSPEENERYRSMYDDFDNITTQLHKRRGGDTYRHQGREYLDSYGDPWMSRKHAEEDLGHVLELLEKRKARREKKAIK